MSESKIPSYTKVKADNKGEEYLLPPFVNQETFDSARSYKPQPDDLFVATYPKNGTTWMIHIIHQLIEKDVDLEKNPEYIFNSCLDFAGAEKITQLPLPRIIKTHFKFDYIPMSNEAKYIFVARNPKDTVVSFYYHTLGFPFYQFTDGSFDQFFDLFVNGQVDFGDYFEMVPVWWEESKKRDNIHFLLYEDLKSNFERELLKVADFLGKDYREKLICNDKKFLQQIAHKSSIKEVKKTKAYEPPAPAAFKRPDHLPFARKGIIGDWKNIMNEKQSTLMNELLRKAGEKYPGFDKLWSNYQEYL